MNVEQISWYTNLASLVVVLVMWLTFGGIVFLRKRAGDTSGTKRKSGSWIGLALQLAGIGLALIPRIPFASPMIDQHFEINVGVQITAIFLAVSSVWLVASAIRELGKQWSIQARLIEGHKLVTSGVYNMVRHPIYTAMLGMLLATGFVVSNWIALATAVIVFLIGTKIRTNIEESLLREAFSDEFEEWKAKVPGLIPFMKAISSGISEKG
ncbi:MAG: methyltransferase family protein [Pyrinomonadaceae bacterium]